ncbi:MAG: MMPL family transporter [Bacteroidales bacterium]|nr:MMPL family transporter [Candidatus Liminaster caballi]
MIDCFVRIHDWVNAHRRLSGMMFMLLLAVCAVMAIRLDYKEEITDFLPVDDHYRQSMRVYQEVASANKVVIQFIAEEGAEVATEGEASAVAGSIIAAATRFGDLLPEHDTLGWVSDYQPQIDYTQILDVADFVYSHLPYLLDEEDYVRMDSLLRDPAYLTQRFEWIRQQLAGIGGTMMMPMLQHDPLGIGNRVASHLRDFQPEANFMQHDGYLFTPDGRCCLVTVQSPFGSSESGMNGRLVSMLQDVADEVSVGGVEIRLTGAPVIAVGNASQIRHDTILAVSVSVVLILILLLWAFRSLRALVYIAISTGFGFLLALAGIYVWAGEVSLIAIGVASVIIGIAVNYPLHFVCHGQEVGDGRRVLSDLVKPLLVGNVTTVAAFLTLVPLEAVAIRQLGLFSALMLVGTILFVLLVMPHLPVPGVRRIDSDGQSSDRLYRLITHPLSLVAVLGVTAVLGYYSFNTEFDSNVSHLNFMTDVQRADMQRLQLMQGQPQGVVVYLPGTVSDLEQHRPLLDSLRREGIVIDEKNPTWFLASAATQRRRLALWHDFWQSHDYLHLLSQSRLAGFSDEAFEPFRLLVEETPAVIASEAASGSVGDTLSYADYEPLTSSILTGYCNRESSVARLTVADADEAQRVESMLPGSFDLTSLNARIAEAMTADFNYIGFACALIVFAFLWLSFGQFKVAVIAFAPMVVGWIWILGLMQLLGVQFNIVNIILATFIFGQGDDYTIFITEGLLRDHRQGTGRRVLRGYQRSILLSALIMLVGIGSLILARHPAMHSLAEVTIVGMTVVVVMAWIIPPMMFHWVNRFWPIK